MSVDDIRQQLPDVSDADNPLVWCERCKGRHRHYTFTRQDFDRLVREQVESLSAAIDAAIVARVMADLEPGRES